MSDTEGTLSMTDQSDSEDSEYSPLSTEGSTLLEYARSHGLCTDYTSVNPLELDTITSLQLDLDFSDDDLCEVSLGPHPTTNEKLALDKATLMFLHSALFMANNISIHILGDSDRLKEFKAESPLLSSDPRLDIRRFATKPDVGNAIDATKFSRFALDPNDGLEWLSSDLLAVQASRSASEKLHLTISDTAFLRKVCCSPCLEARDDCTGREATRKDKIKFAEHEELPILTLSSPYRLEIPDQCVSHLPYASSPPDPSRNELEQLDRFILDQDAITLPELRTREHHDSAVDSDDTNWALTTHESATPPPVSSSPRKRQLPESFKEELPLLPITSNVSPFKKLKTVTFSEVLTTTIPGRTFDVWSSDCGAFEDDGSKILDDLFLPAAKLANDEAEHEQLSEADSTMRVEVPAIDHTMPPPPWTLYAGDQCVTTGKYDISTLQADFFTALKRTFLHDEKQWTGRFDHDVGTWELFDRRPGEAVTDEELDHGSLQCYLSALPRKGTEEEVWKPEGLRVLDMNSDDDDELEEGEFEGTHGPKHAIESLQTLLSRHQQKIHEADIRISDVGAPIPARMIQGHGFEVTTGADTSNAKIAPERLPMLANAFSASSSLERFMQAHIGTMTKTEPLTFKWEMKASEKATPPITYATIHTSDVKITKPMPIPRLNVPPTETERHFIIPLAMLKHRSLIQKIEGLYPTARWIERDFHRLNISTNSSSAADMCEADLLLSSSTGMLFTTLQLIKQKALPGQAGLTGIRDRIMSLMNRYKNLIILISEGRSTSLDSSSSQEVVQKLDERDCVALNSLIAFTSQLGKSVHVAYVPGGQTDLAKWTVFSMRRWGIDKSEAKLTLDETYWELFLRRAGLNAYAAQVVLVMLKEAPQGGDGAQSSSRDKTFGLPTFVQMASEMRKRRFSSILGGHEVLDRLSKSIDGQW